VQSPFWHNLVYGSKNVTFDNISLHSIQASGKQAQNTDGWDIYRSDTVHITNSNIINGDDCVSFKPNTTNALVQNLYCQGSHGISVGSLGQYAGVQDIVANVLVKNVTMVNAENGARIKAFGGSASATSTTGGGNGYVKNITFQDFTVQNVALPVVIDQCYETSASTCSSYPSKVTIGDVHYINVTGTGSKSKEVVSLVCSDVCQDITATGTRLVGTSGSSQYFCTNIASTASLDFPCNAAGAVVSGSGGTTSAAKTKTSTSVKAKTTTLKTSKVGADKARATG
jgi:polygalacturonase